MDLYCPECYGKVWVRPFFEKSYESCTKAKVAEKLSVQKHSSGTVKVLLLGKLDGGSFQIQCIEKAEYITKEYHLPDRLSPKALRHLSCK